MPVCTQLRQGDGVLISQDYWGKKRGRSGSVWTIIMRCYLQTTETKDILCIELAGSVIARIVLLSLLTFIVESICRGGLSPVYCCLLTWGHGTLNAAQVRIIWKLHLGGNRQQLS